MKFSQYLNHIIKHEEMDDETTARYLCLLERLEFIDKKLEDLGVNEEELETARASNRVHKALLNYIDERYNAMLYDLKVEKRKTID